MRNLLLMVAVLMTLGGCASQTTLPVPPAEEEAVMRVLSVAESADVISASGYEVELAYVNRTGKDVTFPFDGDQSQLPRVTVPPAYISFEQLREGVWTEIVYLSDGIAVELKLKPQQYVRFTAFVPHTAARGIPLRVKVGRLTSDSFQLPASPAGE